MNLRAVAFDHPRVEVRGALDLRRTARGLQPRRLPAWAYDQLPDPALGVMADLTSGVRLVLRSDTRRLEVDMEETALRLGDAPRRPPTLDLLIDGALWLRAALTGGPTLAVDTQTRPPRVRLEPGSHSTLRFGELPSGVKTIEIWLPHTASTQLIELRIEDRAILAKPERRRPRWAHYGSSISHAMEAEGPSATWPARAAGLLGWELTSLGFAGQCLLDGVVARAMADLPADLISLKLGINVVNMDAMRERAFLSAAATFLDILRDRHPRTPILIISPIICPAAESSPGPTVVDGARVRTVARGPDLATGALTLQRIRRLLSLTVERRRAAGDHHIAYLDGLTLFGEDDVADLYDGLHPNAEGQARIGRRFAEIVGAGVANWSPT